MRTLPGRLCTMCNNNRSSHTRLQICHLSRRADIILDSHIRDNNVLVTLIRMHLFEMIPRERHRILMRQITMHHQASAMNSSSSKHRRVPPICHSNSSSNRTANSTNKTCILLMCPLQCLRRTCPLFLKDIILSHEILAIT